MILAVTFGRILKIPWKAAKKTLGLRFASLRVLLGLKYFQRFRANAPPGSFAWLALREEKYGGYVTNVPVPHQQSPHAPEGFYQADRGAGGGDRMLHHYYGPACERYLKPYIDAEKPPVILMEIGILLGSGLAIWSDLFPSGRIIGLDIDLSCIENNMDNLLSRGAFQNGRPELRRFDQFQENNDEFFRNLLGESAVDICIDDASHHPEASLSTFRAVQSHLGETFVYFIEDCGSRIRRLMRGLRSELALDGCKVEFHRGLTVISRRRSASDGA